MTEANGSRRELRSEAWFSGLNMFTFAHRSWNGRGYPPDVFDGRPVIGICNSWSELTTCNAHLRIVAEHVKRGVWEAGGLPLEFPTISLGESMMKPTTMLWRNLMSMDVEESLRANPLDGVVLLCGCDKTTPAQLMGAASADLPTIVHARRADAERPMARTRRSARARTSGASRTCASAARSPTRSTCRSRRATRAPTATATRWARPAR